MAGLRHLMQRHSGAKGWCGRGVLLLRSGIWCRVQLSERIALENMQAKRRARKKDATTV